MNILVCISKVPDTTSKITFTDNNSKFNESGVQFIINPYDELYALVRSVEIKEALGGEVTVLNVGKADNEQIIRKALAIGADKAIRVDADPTDAMFVAQQIAAQAKAGQYDMILLGKETIDYNGSVVGGMVAELLGLPYISLASDLQVDGQSATLIRDIEGGKEVLKVSMPFVASAQKGMAEARITNMRGIMMSKSKPLTVVAATEVAPSTHITSYILPAEKGHVKLVAPDDMDELVRLLHEDAKAI